MASAPPFDFSGANFGGTQIGQQNVFNGLYPALKLGSYLIVSRIKIAAPDHH